MQKYFYIPLSYEYILSQLLTEWIYVNGWYTIISPVYKPSTEVKYGFSPIINKTILGDVQTFPYSRAGASLQLVPTTEQTNENLIGFTIVADLQTYLPEVYTLLQSKSDIYITPSNTEYLAYLSQLTSNE